MTTTRLDRGRSPEPVRTFETLLAPRPSDNPVEFVGLPATAVSARMFGGHLLAQALMSTARTVSPDFLPISVHALFLRPGDSGQPTDYRVGSPRDGRAYATRTAEASQHERVLSSMVVQWQRPEEWLDAGGVDGVLPERPPEQPLPYAAPGVLTEVLDLRWVDTSTGRALWFRPRATLPADPVLHTAVALYVSDLWLVDTLLRGFGERFDSPGIRAGSLDHAAWFHRPPVLDDWVCLTSWAPVAAGGRGLVEARLHAANGALLATFAQEASVRIRRQRDADAKTIARSTS